MVVSVDLRSTDRDRERESAISPNDSDTMRHGRARARMKCVIYCHRLVVLSLSLCAPDEKKIQTAAAAFQYISSRYFFYFIVVC